MKETQKCRSYDDIGKVPDVRMIMALSFLRQANGQSAGNEGNTKMNVDDIAEEMNSCW